jgi:hypothetical protein
MAFLLHFPLLREAAKFAPIDRDLSHFAIAAIRKAQGEFESAFSWKRNK